MQSVFRMYKGKLKAHTARAERRRNECATKLQAAWRCLAQLKSFARMLDERAKFNAAAFMQKNWRRRQA